MDRSRAEPQTLSRQDDRGASLILALIFMVVVSLIVLAMASWATTGLRSTINFTAAQSTVSSANSVAELAVQESRYSFLPSTLNAYPPAPCWSSGPTPLSPPNNLNSQTLSAYCSTRWNPSSYAATRKVTIDVCLESASATAAGDCANAPLLQVVVTFDDYPAAGGTAVCVNQTGATYWTTCGTYMKINSWVFGSNPPTVIATQAPGGATLPCTTHDFWVSGTNFVPGSTNVYFVVNGAANQSYQATNVSASSSTYLTGCEPSTGSTGSTVATVVVSTPMGQSQQTVTITY